MGIAIYASFLADQRCWNAPCRAMARHPLPSREKSGILAPFSSMTGDRSMASQTAHPPQNTTALGVGFGIGIIWWIMAGTSLFSAYRGYSNDRYDWGLLWGLVGLLLLGAGTAAMAGTWWHLTRVRDD
jgi:hypothetical protein